MKRRTVKKQKVYPIERELLISLIQLALFVALIFGIAVVLL